MKSAGKARSNGLYRHIRTSKEIIRNLLNDLRNFITLINGMQVYLIVKQTFFIYIITKILFKKYTKCLMCRLLTTEKPSKQTLLLIYLLQLKNDDKRLKIMYNTLI